MNDDPHWILGDFYEKRLLASLNRGKRFELVYLRQTQCCEQNLMNIFTIKILFLNFEYLSKRIYGWLYSKLL